MSMSMNLLSRPQSAVLTPYLLRDCYDDPKRWYWAILVVICRYGVVAAFVPSRAKSKGLRMPLVGTQCLTPRRVTMAIRNTMLPDQVPVEIHVFATLLPKHRLTLGPMLISIVHPEMRIVAIEVRLASNGNIGLLHPVSSAREAICHMSSKTVMPPTLQL
jgi:hypothetical protein